MLYKKQQRWIKSKKWKKKILYIFIPNILSSRYFGSKCLVLREKNRIIIPEEPNSIEIIIMMNEFIYILMFQMLDSKDYFMNWMVKWKKGIFSIYLKSYYYLDCTHLGCYWYNIPSDLLFGLPQIFFTSSLQEYRTQPFIFPPG